MRLLAGSHGDPEADRHPRRLGRYEKDSLRTPLAASQRTGSEPPTTTSQTAVTLRLPRKDMEPTDMPRHRYHRWIRANALNRDERSFRGEMGGFAVLTSMIWGRIMP